MSRFVLSAFADEIASDFATQLSVLSKLNIHHIDIRGVNSRNITQFTVAEIIRLKRDLDARGVKVAAIGSPIGKTPITDEFEPQRVLFEHVMRAAEVLQTRYIRIFSFYITQENEYRERRQEVIDRLGELAHAAERNGLILIHENEKDIYGDTAERCRDILKTIDSVNLRAVFDPANFIQCGEIPYPDAFIALKEYVSYVHVKDAVRSSGINVPAGEGDGSIPELISRLNSEGYDGFLTLEPHLAAFEGLHSLERHLNLAGKSSEKDGEARFSEGVLALRKILNNQSITVF